MIATTDVSSFTDLGYDTSSLVIPTEQNINNLVQASDFKTTQITSALKSLLLSISNNYYQGSIVDVPIYYLGFDKNLSSLFKLVGFSRDNQGLIAFNAKSNELDAITKYIIDELLPYKTFKQKAIDAFKVGTWEGRANNIRVMTGLNLNKIHYIGVYNSNNENTNSLLNIKDENTRRFLEISTVPSMPILKIYNYSNKILKIRIKIEFMQMRSGANYRKFIDYFPSGIPYSIGVGENLNFSFGSKIRGGKATIEYITSDESWNDDLKIFKFSIIGKNPTVQQIKDYLNLTRTGGSYIGRYWFLLKLMMTESNLLQFNSNDIKRLGKVKGMPVFGNPAGFGLGQIDNFGKDIPILEAGSDAGTDLSDYLPGGDKEYQTLLGVDSETYLAYKISNKGYAMKVASNEAVWNWKKNIDDAVRVADLKAKDIITSAQKNIYVAIKDWNVNHPNDKVIVPNDITYINNDKNGNEVVRVTFSWVKSSIPKLNITELNELFSPSQVSTSVIKSFFDARILKSYNGLGDQAPQLHFVYFLGNGQGVKPSIRIYETAHRNGENVNYVKDVSLQNV